MNNNTVYRHYDILQQCYAEIVATFDKVGGIAPALSELFETKNWRYCKTQNRKDFGKIGYRCHFTFADQKPVVKIVVHSFKGGGETVTFNSLSYRPLTPVSVLPQKRVIPRALLQNQEQQQLEAKKARFRHYLKQWHEGSLAVASHPYVTHKNILYTSPLRRIGNNIAFTLQSIDNKIVGLQFIDEQGNKRIYGEKKSAFAVLGKLESAHVLYVCEGFATANAIYQCASTKNSFAVVAGIDAHNMVLVAKLLKQKYPLKILVICADNDADTFNKGKGNPGLISGFEAAIQNYSEIKIPSTEFGSDWCDWWQARPLDAEKTFQQKTAIKLQDFALTQLQMFKADNPGLMFKKALFRTFKLLVNDYPHKRDEQSILDGVFKAVCHINIQLKEIRAIWIRVKKRRYAMALRAKSFSRVSRENITFIECDSIKAMSERIRMLKKKHPRAIFATNAPMGAGKTQHLMQPEFIEAEQHLRLPVIITPMRSLTQGVAERFFAFHYQQDLKYINDKEHLPASLAITINSIINPQYQNCLSYCRNLFIDEYTQVIRALTLGTVENHLRQTTENKLAELMKNADYTFIADADLNQIALDHMQAAVNKATPIFVLTLATVKKNKAMLANNNCIQLRELSPLKQTSQEITYRCHQFKNEKLAPVALLEQIQQALLENKKIYVVTDSKKQVDKIEIALKNQEHLKILAITSDSVNFTESKAFLEAPDSYLTLNRPDIVIVSPAVQSGISIESNYFDHVFGIYTGTVAPVVFQQMLHRIRSQTIFNLVLPTMRNTTTADLENSTALLIAAYQQHLKQFGERQAIFEPKTGLTHIGKLKIKEEDGQILIEGDPLYQRYEKLAASMQALENQQRHYAPQFLLLQAKARGIRLELVLHNLDSFSKLSYKITQDTLKAQLEFNRTLALCGEDTLTDKSYQALQIKGAKTLEDVNNLQRHEIASQLHIKEVNPKDIKFFDIDGAKSLKNYEALCNGSIHANSLDEEDKRKGVAKTNAKWRRCKVTLLNLLFTELNINPETGQGIYNKTQAKKLREHFINDEELSRYILFKLKLKTTNSLSNTAFINKLFKKLLSFKIKRLQIREGKERYWVYFINQDSFSELKFYYQNNLQRDNANIVQLSPESVIY